MATGAELRVFTHTAATLNGDTVELRPAEPIPVGDNHFTRGAVIETLQPSAIINATGAWVDHTLNELRVASRRLMRGTQGSHLVSFHPGLRASLGDGGVYAEAPDGRPIFVLPFGTATLIGTTDLPFEGDPAEAVASVSEVDYLLEAVGQLFPQAALTRQDVTLHYSGVVPRVFWSSHSNSAATRRSTRGTSGP